ncbi:MAG TPA: hypothetical protein VFU60_20335 [Ktedonobacterales bacterium]|nr:hypothetical protein [Ktedonobacterales bacterium]
MPVAFAPSVFLPIAIGFFGLGCGYFIWGGQALFGFPESKPEVNKSMGMWGFWMPGFMQFITGVYLMVGMTWFGVFSNQPPLYMAALAFTAYGIHWFAMAHRRYIGSSSDADGWMAMAFLILSILGVVVFVLANDIPVAIVFVGLSLIYLTEIPARFLHSAAAARTVGLWQFLTGLWLMYMTIATVINVSFPHMTPHLWL